MSKGQELTDGEINEITLDTLGKWPSFETQSWACKVVHAVVARQQAPAEHAAEPVAWVSESAVEGQPIDGRPRRVWWENKLGVGLPLYAAPPDQSARIAELERALADAKPEWSRLDPVFVVDHIRKNTILDADLVEAMLQFAIDAALAKHGEAEK